MTGNRQLRAWPTSDGLGAGDGVAEGLAEASGGMLALGANPQAHVANANTTTGTRTLLTSISTVEWRSGYSHGVERRRDGVRGPPTLNDRWAL
jgi:hypothetical protein